jgi:hypothetical protein
MTISLERFSRGSTYQQWLDGMTQNKERFLQNYEAAQIRPQDVAAFKALASPLKVLVLAEDWCGDVIANVPILAKLAQACGRLDLRIFKRDENLDIMDQYLNQGQFRSIPAIVFFDQQMKEIGRWFERPQIARDEMAEARRRFAAEHTDLPDAGKPVPEMSDATRQLYVASFGKLRAENAARWTEAVVDEWRAVLGV